MDKMRKFRILLVILIVAAIIGFSLWIASGVRFGSDYTVSYNEGYSVTHKYTKLDQTEFRLHNGETLRLRNLSETALPIRFNGAVLKELAAGEEAVYTAYGDYSVNGFDLSGKAMLRGTLHIVGTPVVGIQLHAEYTAPTEAAVLDETIIDSLRLSYQWYRDGAPIEGETSAEYAVRNPDRNSKLSVAVYAEQEAASGTVTSDSVIAYAEIRTLILRNAPTTCGEQGINGTLKLPKSVHASLAAKKAVSTEDAIWAYWLLRPDAGYRFAACLTVNGAPEGYILTETVSRENQSDYEAVFGIGAPLVGDRILCWPVRQTNGSITLLVDANVTQSAEDRAENVRYRTLADALDFADTGDIIRLESDICENATVAQGKAVTLDLNGHVLSGADPTDGTLCVKAEAIDGHVIQGSLTIMDSDAERLHYFRIDESGVWTQITQDEAAVDAESLEMPPEAGMTVAVRGGCIVGIAAGRNTGCRGIYNYGSNVVLNGGSVIGGSDDIGGGICNIYGRLCVNGGRILGNAAEMGGGIFNQGGTCELTGGFILANTAKYTGGGVYNEGELLFYSGEICRNTAEMGGGIYNEKNTVISGGEISGNRAVQNGGGVQNLGSTRMTGGEICGNSAQMSGGFENAGTLSVGGSAEIGGNVSVTDYGEAYSNLALMTPFTVLDGENAPEVGMNIGVTALELVSDSLKSFTGKVSTNGTEETAAYFTADHPNLYLCCQDNALELVLSPEYAEALQWAADIGIAESIDEVLLTDQPCTRSRFAAMLWQLSGSPEPVSGKNPFEDVNQDAVSYKAVLWAAENGILNGTSKTAFSPEDICTRAQIVTILWRMAGAPQPKRTECAFKDVPEGEYYRPAVLWASECGLIEEEPSAYFEPLRNACLTEVVKMLWKRFA